MIALKSRKRLSATVQRRRNRPTSRGPWTAALSPGASGKRALLAVITPTLYTDGVTGGTATLRDCVIYADHHAGTTIQLNAGVYTLSLANTTGQENAAAKGDLDITASTTIQGCGASTVIDQTAVDRVFQIIGTPSISVTLQNLFIEGGKAVDNGPQRERRPGPPRPMAAASSTAAPTSA